MSPLSLQFLNDLESWDIPRQCGQPILLWPFSVAYILGISKGNSSEPMTFNIGQFICLDDVSSRKTRNDRVQEWAPDLRLQVQGYVLGNSLSKRKLLRLHWLGQVTWGYCVPRKGSWQLKLDSSMIASPIGPPSHSKAIKPWPYSSRDGFHQGHIQRDKLEWAEPPPPAAVSFVSLVFLQELVSRISGCRITSLIQSRHGEKLHLLW